MSSHRVVRLQHKSCSLLVCFSLFASDVLLLLYVTNRNLVCREAIEKGRRKHSFDFWRESLVASARVNSSRRIMKSSSSPVPPEETAATMTTTEEPPASPVNAPDIEEEPVSEASISPKNDITPENEDTLQPTIVSNGSSAAENDDKPMESPSSPSTPATLSVNEDNLDESEEQEEEALKEKLKTSSSRKRVPYKYDPNKVTLRFIFANRDGISVTLDCEPADTVGEVKGALLSVWPKELPACGGGDRLRLICMGKGLLMPDTRTLEECQVPTFKTHATPVNVSIRPDVHSLENEKLEHQRRTGTSDARNRTNTNPVEQGCSCVIL